MNGIPQNDIELWENKPVWKYVKSPKQETLGISALKSNGNVITDSLPKAGFRQCHSTYHALISFVDKITKSHLTVETL